jgi:hypothetical protein
MKIDFDGDGREGRGGATLYSYIYNVLLYDNS